MRKIEPLKPEELQKLISMGVVSIKPPETGSMKVLEAKAWRHANRDRVNAMKRRYYQRTKKSALQPS